MNPKNKLRGRRYQIHRERTRKRIGVAVRVALVIAVALISVGIISSMLNRLPTGQQANSPSEPKAAIVDQLSLTSPGQAFNHTATAILSQEGYEVDYYPGENITVEFYRNLPTHGYKLIILRIHSSAMSPQGTENPVTFFTSERVTQTGYFYEKLTDQLMDAAYSSEEREKGITYYGISPLFVTQSMKGRFQDTTVIMMGCQGLENPVMAEAFLEKGAKVFIGWSNLVLSSYTDLATSHLLRHLLIEKLSVNESIQQTFKDVGPDPAYDSLLLYYPLEAGSFTIQNIFGNQIMVKTTLEVRRMEFSETRYH